MRTARKNVRVCNAHGIREVVVAAPWCLRRCDCEDTVLHCFGGNFAGWQDTTACFNCEADLAGYTSRFYGVCQLLDQLWRQLRSHVSQFHVVNNQASRKNC